MKCSLNDILELQHVQSRTRYRNQKRYYMHPLHNQKPNHQFSSICNQLTCLSGKFCQNKIKFSFIYLSFFKPSSDDIIFVIQKRRTWSVNFSISVIGNQGIYIKIPLIKNKHPLMASIIKKYIFGQIKPVKKIVTCAINCFFVRFFRTVNFGSIPKFMWWICFFVQFSSSEYFFYTFGADIIIAPKNFASNQNTENNVFCDKIREKMNLSHEWKTDWKSTVRNDDKYQFSARVKKSFADFIRTKKVTPR